MSRTKCVPLKIVYGADVSARTPFLSFTEYLQNDQNASKLGYATGRRRIIVMSIRRPSFWLAAIAVLFSAGVHGRPPITPPTMNELMKESDLVCVLQVKSIAESQKPHPENPYPETWKSYIATCSVVCALKGYPTNGEIRIPFYEHLFDLPERRARAPLVETRQDWLERSVQYLAFLKRGKDGMFVPSSGDLDPGFSFRIMLQSFDLEAAQILRERQPGHNEGGAANRSQPVRIDTNQPPAAAGSGR